MRKILLLALLGVVFLGGTVSAQEKNQVKREKTVSSAAQHLEIYTAVLKQLEVNYVDTLDHAKLLKAALGRMLYELDPYTQYIPAEDGEYLQRLRSGEYGGVGSVISIVDSIPYFSKPTQDAPAYKAGIRAGDEIVEIDRVKCKGKSIEDISKMLRGKPETPITIKVRRMGEKKELTFEFLRKTISMPTIPYWATIAPKTGYIAVNDFIDRTSYDFKQAVAELVEKDGIDKLVIDLRGNGGGIVGEAVNMASLFVPKGTTIVSMKGSHKEVERVYKTDQAPLYEDMKLVILVDDGTASSSEILAGAFQDLDRAVIVGEQSFGKGLVQHVVDLPYDNFMKITIAKDYLPSGRCVQRMDSSKCEDFRTKSGRIVESGSGVTPDSTITDSATVNISYYLYLKNYYFKYANKYQLEHKSIGALEDFEVTDEIYADFCKFVLDSKFTYKLESEKGLKSLQDFVESEGYGDVTSDLFKQLYEALQPNVARDLERFKPEVKKMLETELVERYYFSKGVYYVGLKYDEWVKTAITLFK